MDWFINGGFSMWVILVVGVLALVSAAGFARRPDEAKLPRIEQLAISVKWSSIAGVATDFAAVGTQIPSRLEWAKSHDLPLLVLQGFGESMSPLLFGGAFMSAIALLLAAGHGRLRAQGMPAA
jgi:hypothetical protein